MPTDPEQAAERVRAFLSYVETYKQEPEGPPDCFTYADLKALLAERDEMSAALSEITKLDLRGEKGKGYSASAEMQGAALELFVTAMVDAFKERGGPNYVEAQLRDPRDHKTYFCIVGPNTGKTPHALRLEAEAERDRLREENTRMRAELEMRENATLSEMGEAIDVLKDALTKRDEGDQWKRKD